MNSSPLISLIFVLGVLLLIAGFLLFISYKKDEEFTLMYPTHLRDSGMQNKEKLAVICYTLGLLLLTLAYSFAKCQQ